MKNFFENENTKRIFPNLFQLLWHSATPCQATADINEFPLLKVGLPRPHVLLAPMSQKCMWKGEERNCSQLFRAVPTDSGMCCSFNLALGLVDSQYFRLLDLLGGESRPAAGKAMVGRSKGLSVLLDQHSNQKSFGSLSRDSRGMQVLPLPWTPRCWSVEGRRCLCSGTAASCSSQVWSTMWRSAGWQSRPGTSPYPPPHPTSSGVGSVAPNKRGCYFTTEGELRHQLEYTASSCRFEGMLEEAVDRHNCTPWFLPGAEVRGRQHSPGGTL